MRDLLRTILGAHRKTVVFVTHDIDEAIELADRIIVLTAHPGSIKKEFRLTTIRSDISQKITANLDAIKRAVEECYA
jgi:ABC-type nitrate/sulfonate/bicarbonate transport system ATPase subunit